MKEFNTPTKRDPDNMLPIVTGRTFFKKQVLRVMPVEHNKPAGSKNMFATECSNPIATKVEMGNKILTYLPVMSLAWKDM